MKPEIKKQIILHLPYLAFIYLFGKVGQAFRLAQGADISAKLLHIGQGFSAAFASAAPSFHPTDLLIGLAAAVIIRLVVYSKQKNAKKYRKGMEYGTARWGTAADIKPFIDPVFDNNVLLTATERLMMSNRPKDPKNARNKNILVIGGSGSGKTRFFCKPNIMQLHSSYVITDPKGSLICEVGQLLQRAERPHDRYGRRQPERGGVVERSAAAIQPRAAGGHHPGDHRNFRRRGGAAGNLWKRGITV